MIHHHHRDGGLVLTTSCKLDANKRHHATVEQRKPNPACDYHRTERMRKPNPRLRIFMQEWLVIIVRTGDAPLA
jgi:hypothetical protein